MKRAMTIAGSDSGGGAGIQADLKTFAAHAVWGTSALAALTAQNTRGVSAVQEVPAAFVTAQIDAIMEDIGADSAKTGMIASATLISAVAEAVRRHSITRLVVDPVMVAKSGDKLLHDAAVSALREVLIPLAEVVTPNRFEAEILSGIAIRTREDIEAAARAVHALGARAVVVKGGDIDGLSVDGFYDGQAMSFLQSPRLNTRNTHGTGCTFSAAIAANLALGLEPHEAIEKARDYVIRAIEQAPAIGTGNGPVQHFPA